KNPVVREVSFPQKIVLNVDRYLRVLAIVLLSIATLMLLVSIALIHNTMRLTLYAKRFIIKSMQLVGATQGLIRSPFLLKGFLICFGRVIMACFGLSLTLYILKVNYPFAVEDLIAQGKLEIVLVFFGLSLLGVLISGLSSYLAVGRYLRMKLDDLF